MNQIALTLVDFQLKSRAKNRCWYSEDRSVGLGLWCRALGPQGKWKLCLTLCHPLDYTVHGVLQARILESVAFPFSRGSSQPRDHTQVSHIAGRFSTTWTTRKEQEVGLGVGSLSLLQWIFLTQESNPGLLQLQVDSLPTQLSGKPWSPAKPTKIRGPSCLRRKRNSPFHSS